MGVWQGKYCRFFLFFPFVLIAIWAICLPYDAKADVQMLRELQQYCPHTKIETAHVSAVSREAEIVLDNGRRLRFADIFFPRGAKNNHVAPKTLQFLQNRLTGQSITYLQSAQADRYRRIPAYIVIDNEENLWLQPEILRAEIGFFMPEPLNRTASPDFCDSYFLKRILQRHDHSARGLSRRDRPHLVPIYAPDSKILWQMEGNFVIIEGIVVKTYTSGKRIFWNFGDDWKIDFTAFLSTDNQTSFEKHFKPLSPIEGKQLRMRGFLDLKNGPSMRIDHPLQVELLSE